MKVVPKFKNQNAVVTESHRQLVITCLVFATLASCGKASIKVQTRTSPSAVVDKDALKGHVDKTWLASLWNMVGACGDNTKVVALYQGGFDSSKTPLATATIDDNGDFKLPGLAALGVKLDGSQVYTLSHSSCDEYYARVVTSHGGQNLTPASTLLSYALSDEGSQITSASDFAALASIEADLVSASSTDVAYQLL